MLPFGRLWYGSASDAIGYAKFYSRSHDAVIRVNDESDNVIETHEHAGDFQGAVDYPFQVYSRLNGFSPDYWNVMQSTF